MCDGDGGGMLLRFIPQRRWIYPGRNGLTEEVRKHMEQNHEFPQLNYEKSMPHMVVRKRKDENQGLHIICFHFDHSYF